MLQFSGSTGTLLAFLVTTFVPGIHTALYWLFLGLSCMCIAGIVVLATCLPQLKSVENSPKLELDTGDNDEAKDNDDVKAEGTTGAEGDDVNLWATLNLCMHDRRMRCLVPIIFYNGASLGFLWNVFNVLGLSTAAGLSFVGLGSAFWFGVNSIFTPIMSKLSNRKGYILSFFIAMTLQSIMYVLLILFPIEPLQCNPSGCKTNTSGPCWEGSTTFPLDCRQGNSDDCVVCSMYTAAKGQKCTATLNQCSWLGYPSGDALAPDLSTMLLLGSCSGLFAIGDAVWETQLPAVLQTIFHTDRNKASALANLKMFQSIGVSLVFAFAYVEDLQLMSALLLVLLLLGFAVAYWMQNKLVDLDTGVARDVDNGRGKEREEREGLL